jgi:hypothetical protein
VVEGRKIHLTDTVEERIARRLIERRNLSPSVDVVSLIRLYADFHEVTFPSDAEVDGLSLNIKALGKRATVLVNRNLPENRKRFTIAHELGHILIPSHCGSIIDDISSRVSHGPELYREREAEANRFAAELLMPYDFVIDMVQKCDNIKDSIIKISADCRTSLEATSLRVQRIGPPNFIFSLENSGKIRRSGRTQRTRANMPIRGVPFSRDLVHPHDQYFRLDLGGGTLHIWHVRDSAQLPPQPGRASKEILESICARLDLSDPKWAKMSINGIVSVANGSVKQGRTRERVYAAILHNVANRDTKNSDVFMIMNDTEFDDFLVARAYEFKI